MRSASIVTALLAATAIARAQAKPVEAPGVLEELLKNEDLVKRFATVGYPLADEIGPRWDCTTDPIDVGFARYEQGIMQHKTGATIPFDVGLDAILALASYDDQLGVSMVAEPYVEAFAPPTQTPIGVNVHADMYPDGTSSVDVRIIALGYIVDAFDQRTINGASYARQFGYQLPAPAEGEWLDAQTFQDAACECQVGWRMRPTTYAYVSGKLLVQSAATGIQARALLSAMSYADLDITGFAFRSQWEDFFHIPGRVDLLRFSFGGRMQLLPRSDGTWVGDTEASASVWKSMDALSRVALSDPKHGNPTVTLLALTPMQHDKDVKIACKLEPKFTLKRGPKP